MSQPLYTHQRHRHQPVNINQRHAAERLGVNDRLAVWISRHVGSMMCAYVFAGIGIGSLVGVLTDNTLLALLCGSFSSYFLQLVLLPILALGQNILGRHAELQAEEQYATTERAFADTEQLVAHLSAQDDLALQDHEALLHLKQSLLEQQEVLFLLLEHLGIEAKFNTAHEVPIVKVGGHELHIDEDKLRASLIRAGMKAELVGMLDVAELLLLDKHRSHEQEERYADAADV